VDEERDDTLEPEGERMLAALRLSHESDSVSRHRKMSKWVRVDIPHVGVSMAVIGCVRQPQSGQHACGRPRSGNYLVKDTE
jgi:hypothetical protein